MPRVLEARGTSTRWKESSRKKESILFRSLFLVGYLFNWLLIFYPKFPLEGYLVYIFGDIIFLINILLLPLILYLVFLISIKRPTTTKIVAGLTIPLWLYELTGLFAFLYFANWWDWLCHFPALIGTLFMMISSIFLLLLPYIKGKTNILSIIGLIITAMCAGMLYFYYPAETDMYFYIYLFIILGIICSGLGMIIPPKLNLSGMGGLLLGLSDMMFLFTMGAFILIR